MKYLLKFILLPLSLILLISCGGNSGKGGVVTTFTQIRVSHTSADAPKVKIKLNDTAVQNGAMFDYAETTGIATTMVGENTIAVDAILPDGTEATVIGPANVTIEDDTTYDVFAIGSVADSTLEAYIVSYSRDFDNTLVRVNVSHLAEAAPMVDVHVTAPGAELSGSTVLGSFSYKQTLQPDPIPAGDYQIRVTLSGELNPVYDSGTLSLSAGSDLTLAAIPNVAATDGQSPISLLILNNDTATVLNSAGDGADLRVVHNSANAPAVDIVVNDNFAAPLVESLAFPNFTPYVNVPAAEYGVKVAVENTQTVALDAGSLDLMNGWTYSVIALNTVDALEALVLADNPRKVATEARLRAIHGSTLAGNVDIYITAKDADIANLDPAVSDFAFKADTGYVSLPEGEYDITLTPTGAKDIALGPLTVDLMNGKIYTVLARDEVGLGGANVTLLDDFNE